MSDNRFRETVYLATVDDSFAPERPWHLPEQASDLRLHARGLSLDQAAGFVGVHNADRMECAEHDGEPLGQWALLAKFVKPRRIRHEMRRRFLDSILEPRPNRLRAYVVCEEVSGKVCPLFVTLDREQAEWHRLTLLRKGRAPFIVPVGGRPSGIKATLAKGGAA